MTARYFEDLERGETHDLGETTITEADVVAFAEQFDPQPFHLGAESAEETPVGELIASGWHTTAAVMRLLVDGFLDDVVVVAAAGSDDVRWREPVRPGDVLSARVEVIALEPWNDDRGLAELEVTATNQSGTLVHERVERVVIQRRSAASDDDVTVDG